MARVKSLGERGRILVRFESVASPQPVSGTSWVGRRRPCTPV